MGKTWRRVTEAVRQTLGGPIGADKNFLVTSNARNEAMFREASEFSAHIRTLERDLQAMEKQVAGQFTNLRDILITPLPKVYERVDYNDLNAIAPRGDPTTTIGRNIHYDRFDKAQKTLAERVQGQVFEPMQEWMADFKRVQTEMSRLKALRLELDSRKRTVAALDKELSVLRDKCLRQGSSRPNTALAVAADGEAADAASEGAGMDAQKLQKMVERTEEVKCRRDEKLRIAQEQYNQLEEAVFRRLETLINDAASLREYAASSLVHIQECFAIAITAFEAPAPTASGGGYIAAAEPVPISPTGAAATTYAANYAEKKPGEKSLLRTLANKLIQVRPPTTGSGRDHEQAADQHQPAVQGMGFDAAAGGKIQPASALAPVDVDAPRGVWAVSPTHAGASGRWQ